MEAINTATKKYFGSRVNVNQYAYVYVRRCLKNEQTVYQIMQLTSKGEHQVIDNVQSGVISYEETLKFAEVYRRLPSGNETAEIYLLGGFDNWNKINSKS